MSGGVEVIVDADQAYIVPNYLLACLRTIKAHAVSPSHHKQPMAQAYVHARAATDVSSEPSLGLTKHVSAGALLSAKPLSAATACTAPKDVYGLPRA